MSWINNNNNKIFNNKRNGKEFKQKSLLFVMKGRKFFRMHQHYYHSLSLSLVPVTRNLINAVSSTWRIWTNMEKFLLKNGLEYKEEKADLDTPTDLVQVIRSCKLTDWRVCKLYINLLPTISWLAVEWGILIYWSQGRTESRCWGFRVFLDLR